MLALKLASMKILFGLMAMMGVSMVAQAIETPHYTVIRRSEVFEIRQYDPYCVAEVEVSGPATDAGNRAFPILAGYIFGKNHSKQTMAMTAPVVQKSNSVKMDMTAPVTQIPNRDGFIVQFVMSKKYTLATLPVPDDSRVKLREIPTQTVAVIRYSGTWSQGNYDKHLEKLKTALQKEGVAIRGEPIYSRYNPPFTPWFMRTNEIGFEVQ